MDHGVVTLGSNYPIYPWHSDLLMQTLTKSTPTGIQYKFVYLRNSEESSQIDFHYPVNNSIIIIDINCSKIII